MHIVNMFKEKNSVKGLGSKQSASVIAVLLLEELFCI